MNADLIRLVQDHQKVLLKEWKQRSFEALRVRLISVRLTPGAPLMQQPLYESSDLAGAREVGDFLVEHLMGQLLLLLEGGTLAQETTLRDELEGFTSSGLRMSLSILMEIILSGETVFRDLLLGQQWIRIPLQWEESVEYFESVHTAFNELLRHYVNGCCQECSSMLEKERANITDIVFQN